MTLARLLNRPCLITHRSPSETPDEYGDKVPAETTVETVCELQAQQGIRTGSESEDQVSDNRLKLFLPAGTEIGAADTVTIDGEDYEVSGEPWQARNPISQTFSHVEAAVYRTAALGDGGS